MFEDLSLPLNIGLFAAAAAAVWIAAVRLTRHADALAARTGLGQEMVGLLLLGGVTSLPELAVAVTATLGGEPALTVNNVLGAAAFNVVLLALADATIRGRALTSVQGSPKVMLIGVLVIVMMALVVAPSVSGDALLLGIGRWTWIILAVYLAAVWVMAHSRAEAAWRPMRHGVLGPADTQERAPGQASVRRLALGAAGAGGVILVAGFLLARTGDAIAAQSGLGTSFFGMVVLAVATSLPEVSTVLAAVRLKRYEMAISDVFGTGLFNVAIIVLVDALHPGGPVLLEAGPFAAFGALLALVLTALFLLGLVERRDRTIAGLGIDSVLALATYLGGLAVLFNLR